MLLTQYLAVNVDHIIAHASNYRLSVRRSGRNRIARIFKSPYHPERDALFTINEEKIEM